jgi:hypothetical protein
VVRGSAYLAAALNGACVMPLAVNSGVLLERGVIHERLWSAVGSLRWFDEQPLGQLLPRRKGRERRTLPHPSCRQVKELPPSI